MSARDTSLHDVLVVGAGPAGLALAAALSDRGLSVLLLSPDGPEAPWPNTYGIWIDELEPLGLTHLLGQRWDDTTAFVGGREIALGRPYGLFDNARMQEYLIARCRQGAVTWTTGLAASVTDTPTRARVTTRTGRVGN